MARKVERVTITDEGRDKDKTFVITELSAAAAEKWATRLLLAVAKSGVDVPLEVLSAGMAGLASMGGNLIGGIAWSDAEPLLDEQMACVEYEWKSGQTRALVDDDIEEIKTRLTLRGAWLGVHVDFSQLAGPSTSASASTTSDSKNTSTSPESSELSSQAALRR